VRHRLVITGANGSLGRTIITRALERQDRIEIVAAVRSERAASEVPPIPSDLGGIERISYSEPGTLRSACEEGTVLVHLPGVLVERPGATYEQAHVETTELAVAAASECGVRKVILVSAVGADPASPNRYFATKGRSEEIVRDAGLPFTVLRAPLLLGPHTEGARALLRETSRSTVWLLDGGRTWHQPMDVGDLAEAVLRAALEPDVGKGEMLDVAGRERLLYRDLVERSARIREVDVRIHGIPVTPVRWALALRSRMGKLGFSPDSLEVLLTDTTVDAEAAAAALEIGLTPLDTTLRRSFLLPVGT
jgi:NADH dehydrogenase